MASVNQSLTASKTKRTAIYPRVSTGHQEHDGTSLASQEEQCRRFAAQRGYVVDESRVHRGVHTGTELWEWPQLSRLREAVRSHDIDVIIAYAIDLLSRDPVHLGVLISEADHHGVSVDFVTEPLDNSPEGQLIRFVRGDAAKVEHEKNRDRTLWSLRAQLLREAETRGYDLVPAA
jgi:DNA invertase Pin-like site-specific DNA recombinase